MAGVSETSPLARPLQRAQALIASGELGGALVLLERAVELGKENLGEDHNDVLAAQRELAGVLLKVDEPVQARRALEEAYAAGHYRLGDADPLMVRISHDLGIVAEELGNRHEARKAFGRVAEHGPAALGDRHPLVVRARAHLGQDQNQGDVRPVERAPDLPVPRPAPVERPVPAFPDTPIAPVQRPMPPAPVQPPQPDPMSAPTTAFPAVVDYRRPAPRPGPWSAPPTTWPQQNITPWPAADVDDQHGRNVPGGVTVWPSPPTTTTLTPYDQTQTYPAQPAPESARRRGMALFAVIAATLAAVVAVAALMFVLADRISGPDAGDDVAPTSDPNGPNVPTPDAPPPAGITLEDQGSAIEVRWTDPAQGRVPFMVTMARPGETLRPVSSVGPGETSFRMGGLNKRLDYCFAVVAVYETDRFATSDQVCTERR